VSAQPVVHFESELESLLALHTDWQRGQLSACLPCECSFQHGAGPHCR
jgi:hypothetical protein